jgi:alkylated DNA repair dioxygenase AlkB
MLYVPELISTQEEQVLLEQLATLPLKEFEFHGFLGKRRVVSFGWRYAFDGSGMHRAEPIPEFLLPVRERAAGLADLSSSVLEHVLILQYRPGAAIGWHKDRPDFGEVIGISLLSPCTFRLRRKRGATWERRAVVAEPRSAYLLRGASRSEWEHSIPPQQALRYSITFRTLASTTAVSRQRSE